MNRDLLVALTNNAALLLALSIVCEISFHLPERIKAYKPFMTGLLASAICVIIMSTRFVMAPGLVFDTRSILISVVAFIFGPVPTLMTVAAAAIYRTIEGGVGLMAGLAVILSSALIGRLWERLFRNKKPRYRLLSLYLMGIVVHVVMLLCMFLLPSPMNITTVREIALPVLLIYPLASLLLSLLLLSQRDRNESINARLEAEARYQSLFNNSHTVMLLVDPTDGSGQILDANLAAELFYGWTRDELRTMRISDINTLAPDELRREMLLAGQLKRNHFHFQHRLRDGSVRAVEIYSGPIQYGDKKLLYSIIHDITEQQAMRRQLISSEERFRTVVQSAPEAIFIQTDGFIVFANPECLRLFRAARPDQLLGSPIFERFHPDYHDVIRERIEFMKNEKQPVIPIEEIYLRLDHSTVNVEVSAVPIIFNKKDSVLVFCRDITLRKQAEQERLHMEVQLRQQQKMDALGLLAGGVAHEINNPINGIMNYAQLVLDEMAQDTTEADYLRGIIQETKRVSEIVRNLLQFSRQDKQAHSYARIEDIISQTLSLIQAIFRRDQIVFQMDLPSDLPSVKCRSQQIQQVLLNLLTNARDALNERYPGYDDNKIIKLSCSAFHEDGRRWISLTVEDHGIGIPEDKRPFIFDPFFSTKPKENGTGLGLSISFGIVRDHHGRIKTESEPGQHTRFHVILPVDNGWTTPAIREE